MFAALDTLITLLIFGGIALVSHFIRRARGGDDFEEPSEPPGPGPRGTTAAPKRMTWEEELRKVLEQRLPAPPPIVREMPRPAPMVFAPQPAPPPLVEPAEPHIEVELSTPRANVEPRFQPLPQFTESAGYERASHLEENVAKHFDELTRHRVGSTTAHHREASREAREVLAMIRNPKTVKTAILASLILGPPRALAE